MLFRITLFRGDRKAPNLVMMAVVTALAILLLTSVAWWLYIRNDPERVFMGMLENNLRTTSVSRRSVQSSNFQQVDQKQRLVIGHQRAAQGITVLEQASNEETAHVVSETVGTPQLDYIRYREIETSQTSNDGQIFDFSDVIDVWGRTSEADGQTESGELYNEMILGVVPFANLPQDGREKLMDIIRDNGVYQLTSPPQKINNWLRPSYVYYVSIQPVGYVTLLKQFGYEAGMPELVNLNPDDYANAQPLDFKVVVDVWSQRLTEIQYSDRRVEHYSGYGVQRKIEIPQETIPMQELQRRIQSAQL